MKKITTEQAIILCRQIMQEAADAAAKQTGMKNKLVEEKLASGQIRIVIEWEDGEQTNECVIEPTGNQTTLVA